MRSLLDEKEQSVSLTTHLPDLAPTGEARLFMGWRVKGDFEGRIIPTASKVSEELRDVANKTIQILVNGDVRTYEPTAELEVGEEYFQVSLSDLPTRSRRVEGEGDAVQQTAAFLDLIKSVNTLEELSPPKLSEHSYLFYGFAFDTDDGNTAVFLKKSDPVRSASKFHISLFGATRLRLTPNPLLSLSDDVDLVITHEKALILNKRAFETLFNDVKVVLQDAPKFIAESVKKLNSKVQVSKKAQESLASVAAKRVSVATRLRSLPGRIDQIAPTPDLVREKLDELGHDYDVLLDGDDFSFTSKNVGLFLDLIEGRHFPDEWTGDRMRADRMSRYQAV